MKNVDMSPTPVRVLGSLAAISIAVTSIAAALMVAPNTPARIRAPTFPTFDSPPAATSCNRNKISSSV